MICNTFHINRQSHTLQTKNQKINLNIFSIRFYHIFINKFVWQNSNFILYVVK